MNTYIDEGDVVDVCFSTPNPANLLVGSKGDLSILAEVLYTPSATGDSYKFRAIEGNTIFTINPQADEFLGLKLIHKKGE